VIGPGALINTPRRSVLPRLTLPPSRRSGATLDTYRGRLPSVADRQKLSTRFRVRRCWTVLPLLFPLASGCSARAVPTPPTSPRIIARLHLDEVTVRSGVPIEGELVLTNTTGTAININQCPLDDWFLPGLKSTSNPLVQSYPASSGVGCNMKIRIAAGVTRYPMTISTTYAACSSGGQTGTIVTPACTSAGDEPPLPAGRYEADITSLIPVSDGRAPPPVEVTLTAPK
jgi:hypothetical protein